VKGTGTGWLAALLLLTIMVQAFWNHFTVLGAPDILLVATCVLAARLRTDPALIFAWAAGLGRDLLAGTPPGLHGFLFLLAALVTRGSRRIWTPDHPMTVFVALVPAVAIVHGFWPVLAVSRGLSIGPVEPVLETGARTLAAGVLFYWPFAQVAEVARNADFRGYGGRL